jgi:predicted DNA-binding protein with PD1-like motif
MPLNSIDPEIHLPDIHLSEKTEKIMKRFIKGLGAAAAAAVFAAAMAGAQETRHTVVHPAAGQTQPNSSSVPDVVAQTGHFERIVVLRLKYKTDLLAGLEQEVKRQHIENGVILAGIGSVRGYQIHQVANRTFPTHDTYVKNPTEPADVVGMNGYVIAGELHPHITLATPDRVMAGHLEPGTQVFTFVLVTIGVLDGVDLRRADDSSYR